MEPTPKQPSLWEMLERFQAELANVHGSLTNPSEKQMLGEVLGELEKTRAEAQAVLADYVKKTKAKVVEKQPQIESLLAQIEEKSKAMEAKKKEQAARQQALVAQATQALPKPAAPPPSGLSAAALSAELLARHGSPPPIPEVPVDPGSLWRQMDSEIKPEPAPQPAPPPKPPVARPKTGPPRTAVQPPENQDASLWPFLDQVSPPDDEKD